MFRKTETVRFITSCYYSTYNGTIVIMLVFKKIIIVLCFINFLTLSSHAKENKVFGDSNEIQVKTSDE